MKFFEEVLKQRAIDYVQELFDENNEKQAVTLTKDLERQGVKAEVKITVDIKDIDFGKMMNPEEPNELSATLGDLTFTWEKK